ncbi:MAG: TIGR04086 family membrane protein [Clostridiales bacterium]|nr:TIGR04086 family membrane protein [Clostridiales bacterium]
MQGFFMQKNMEKSFFTTVFSGAFLTLIISLVAVLIFSIVVKTANLQSGVIKGVNQFIKTLAVFLGCFFSIRGKLGFLKGILIGTLGLTLVFLIFSLLSGTWDMGLSFLIDLAFGGVVGLIAGVISVNVKA